MPLRSHPRPFAVGMQEATRGNVVGDCWENVTIVFDLGSIELSARDQDFVASSMSICLSQPSAWARYASSLAARSNQALASSSFARL